MGDIDDLAGEIRQKVSKLLDSRIVFNDKDDVSCALYLTGAMESVTLSNKTRYGNASELYKLLFEKLGDPSIPDLKKPDIKDLTFLVNKFIAITGEEVEHEFIDNN